MVYQTKGIGGNVMLDCSIFPHYCPQFNWVFNRLEKFTSGFYSTTIKGFCKENNLDLIFKISDLGQWVRGSSTGLEKVLSNKIVLNKISNSYFKEDVFCDEPLIRYFLRAHLSDLRHFNDNDFVISENS